MDTHPNNWINGDTNTNEMNLMVQREMSNLKALKRLSLNTAIGSALDPDLPDPVPSLEITDMSESSEDGNGGQNSYHSENYSDEGGLSLFRTASSKRNRSSSQSSGVNPASNYTSTNPRFARHHSITRQTNTVHRERSAPVRSKISTEQPLDLSEKAADDGDIQNMWVPAGLHPELAPNEWQAFVDAKLSEIRNSQEAQQQSRSSKPHSRLSHIVSDPEEYIDASALLYQRRSSPVDRRKSILELSRDFVNDEEENSEPIAPRTNLGGATSLRRSTHRMHKPSKPVLAAKPEPKPESAEPESESTEPKPQYLSHSLRKQRHKKIESMDFSDAAPVPTRPLRMRPPLKVSVPSANAVAHTAEQPPSPSAATPSPNASGMLGYRRRMKETKKVENIEDEVEKVLEQAFTPTELVPQEHPPTLTPTKPDMVSYVVPQEDIHTVKQEVARPFQPEMVKSEMVNTVKPEMVNTIKPEHKVEHKSESTEHSVKRLGHHRPLSDLGSTERDHVHSPMRQTITREDIEPASPPKSVKPERRWKWLDSQKEFKETKETKETIDSKEKDSKERDKGVKEKEPKKTFANLFKKNSKPKAKSVDKSPKLDKSHKIEKAHKVEKEVSTPSRRKKGHARVDSRVSNDADHDVMQTRPSTPVITQTRPEIDLNEVNSNSGEANTGDANSSDTKPRVDIKLPYDIPAHQVSDRSYIMMYHRFPLHIERAIYRLSHMKLTNPRRPLLQQVLLSNFMYAYLNLVNYGYQQQQLAAMEEQQQQHQSQSLQQSGRLEESQIEQLRRIETNNYEDSMYTRAGGAEEDDSSSSSEDEPDSVKRMHTPT